MERGVSGVSLSVLLPLAQGQWRAVRLREKQQEAVR